MAMSESWVESELAKVDLSGPKRGGYVAAGDASPFDGLSAERLSALGVSPAWAGVTTEQLAEMQRLERRRAIASRLGVAAEYLPLGIEDAD